MDLKRQEMAVSTFDYLNSFFNWLNWWCLVEEFKEMPINVHNKYDAIIYMIVYAQELLYFLIGKEKGV